VADAESNIARKTVLSIILHPGSKSSETESYALPTPELLGYLLIFSVSQSAICGITTGQYSTAQCSPRPSSHRSPSFAAW
jgi:hypothetical protein